MGVGSQADGFAFDPFREGFDPYAPGVMDDPYPYYAVLRERDPVHVNRELGTYFLSRYDDVLRATRDDAHFIRGQQARYFDDYGPAARILLGGSLLTKDPPDHTRLKLILGEAFARAKVDALGPRIEELCAGALDDLGLQAGAGGGAVELVRGFCYRLPAAVVCEILGVPGEDWDAFRGWATDIVPIIDPFPPLEVRVRGEAGCTAMVDYLMLLVHERRRRVRAGERLPGLVTTLVQLVEGGERLTTGELIMLCGMAVIAGLETVANLIGCALRALLDHPDQLEALRREPDLYGNLADESLRFYSTGQYTVRDAAEDVVVAGRTIPRGAKVVLLLGSANRDERHFADAGRFDLRRPNSADHLGFGEGPTRCTGARLSRMELEIAIRTLLGRVTPVRISRWVQRQSKLIWGPSEVVLEYV